MQPRIAPQILKDINRLVRQRYLVAAEFAEENRRHEMAVEQITARAAELDQALVDMTEKHYDEILDGSSALCEFETHLARIFFFKPSRVNYISLYLSLRDGRKLELGRPQMPSSITIKSRAPRA